MVALPRIRYVVPVVWAFTLAVAIGACARGGARAGDDGQSLNPNGRSNFDGAARTDPLAASGVGVDVRLWILSPPLLDAQPVEPPNSRPTLGATARLPSEERTGNQPSTFAPGPRPDDAEAGTRDRADAGARSSNRAPNAQRRTGSLRPRAAADAQATLERLAAEFDQSGLDAGLVASWERNGLRVVRVPADRLPGLRQRLGLLAPEQQQLIGFSSSRVPIARGTPLTSSEALELDTGVLTLERGFLRLLLRSWPVPGDGARTGSGDGAGDDGSGGEEASRGGRVPALVRLEVTPQAVRDEGAGRPGSAGASVEGDASGSLASRLASFALNQSVAAEDAGPVFQRLALEASFGPGDALVIFAAQRVEGDGAGGEAHEEDMAAGPEDYLAEPLLTNDQRPPTRMISRSEVGPDVPSLASLGEALLTDALAATPRGERLVLVLIPRPPRGYSLLR